MCFFLLSGRVALEFGVLKFETGFMTNEEAVEGREMVLWIKQLLCQSEDWSQAGCGRPCL